MLAAVLTSGQVGCIAIFLLIDVDATLALQDEALVADFSDEMFASASRAQAVLVVRKRTALTVDKRRNIGAIVADLTAFNVARAKQVAARQSLERFSHCFGLWHGGSWCRI